MKRSPADGDTDVCHRSGQHGPLFYDRRGFGCSEIHVGASATFREGHRGRPAGELFSGHSQDAYSLLYRCGEWPGHANGQRDGLPRQMMLGANERSFTRVPIWPPGGGSMPRMGIGELRSRGDINNNPDNPVINDRSFGEDKLKVAQYGIQYVKGFRMKA